MKAVKPSAPSERSLQRATAAYFKAVLLPEVLWFHCPNEGKRGLHAQADFKLGGGLPGVADWYLAWQKPIAGRLLPDGRSIITQCISVTIWLELKSATGKLTPAQEAFRQRVIMLGHHYEVCRTPEAVVAALRGRGVPMRPHSFLASGVVRVAA